MLWAGVFEEWVFELSTVFVLWKLVTGGLGKLTRLSWDARAEDGLPSSKSSCGVCGR